MLFVSQVRRRHLIKTLPVIALSSFAFPVLGQDSGVSAFRDLAEIKAECQRVSKLHLEKAIGMDSERVQRRTKRAVAELQEYVSHAPAWQKYGVSADGAQRLAVNVRALSTLVLADSSTRTTALDSVTLSDRCTADADALFKEVKGVGAGSRAMAQVAKTLFLSQRVVRDYMAVSSKLALPPVRAAQLKAEVEDLTASLAELGKLPSTPGMQSALIAVRQQWTIVRPKLSSATNSQDELKAVVRSSEVMFEAIDELFDEVIKAARAFN